MRLLKSAKAERERGECLELARIAEQRLEAAARIEAVGGGVNARQMGAGADAHGQHRILDQGHALLALAPQLDQHVLRQHCGSAPD